MHMKIISAIVGLGLSSGAVATQTQLSDEIIVTGESRKEIQRRAQAYVRQVGVAVGTTQAARWLTPICPRAIGLNKEHAALVEERIRKNIANVGAPLALAACEPNLLVAFTDNANAVMRRITRLDAAPTRRMSPRDAGQLKNAEAPVRWWYNTGTQSRDSASESGTFNPTAKFTDKSGNVVDPPVNDRSTVLSQYNSSFISTLAVRAIHAATVVVDVERASGMPLSSVIDYATLVGLAEIKLAAAPDGSILSLFQPGTGQRELSDRDVAFLKGLYRITMDRRADQQQRTLVGQMVKEAVAN